MEQTNIDAWYSGGMETLHLEYKFSLVSLGHPLEKYRNKYSISARRVEILEEYAISVSTSIIFHYWLLFFFYFDEFTENKIANRFVTMG